MAVYPGYAISSRLSVFLLSSLIAILLVLNTISLSSPNVKEDTGADSSQIGVTDTANRESLEVRPKTDSIGADQSRQAESQPKSERVSFSDWILLLTAGILLLSVIIAWYTYVQKSRPIIKISLGHAPTGLQLHPVLTNLTSTEAFGLVVLNFVVNETDLYLHYWDEGAYCGAWVWNFPARGWVRGNHPIESAVRGMFQSNTIPKGQKLALDAVVYYMRWKPMRWGWFSRVWRRWTYHLYCSPIHRWEMNQNQQWVFVPAHRKPRSPRGKEKSFILKKEREMPTRKDVEPANPDALSIY